jgi:hypothetical protein
MLDNFRTIYTYGVYCSKILANNAQYICPIIIILAGMLIIYIEDTGENVKK